MYVYRFPDEPLGDCKLSRAVLGAFFFSVFVVVVVGVPAT